MEGLPLYKHLYRDKWINTKQAKLDEKYYKHEQDKNGYDFMDKPFRIHEIIVSDTNPNKGLKHNQFA